MKSALKVTTSLVFGLLCQLGVLSTAQSQTAAYPAHPVRVIVPVAAGGPSDVVARILTQKLSASLGQNFYIDNQPGAGQNIGIGKAARAPADGYTLVVVSSSYTVNPFLYAKVPYDPQKDFSAVSLIGVSPNILLTTPSLPAANVQELVSLVKAHPGKYGYAHSGIGTTPQLAGALFNLSQGLDLVGVPYNGSGPAVQSVMAGHAVIAFSALTPAVAQVNAGKVRALAVTTAKRSAALPDVPTLKEAGLPNQESDTMTGILVPSGTPAAVIDLLNLEVTKALSDPKVKSQLTTLGVDIVGSSPAEFESRIKAELSRWSGVIRQAHLSAE